MLLYDNMLAATPLYLKLKVVENREGSRWTPACVSFKGDGDPVVGTMAKAQRFEVNLFYRQYIIVPSIH